MAQQTPFPPPQYGPPRRSRGPLVLVGVLALVLVLLLATGAVILLRSTGTKAEESAPATKPAAPESVEFRRVMKHEPGACASQSTNPSGTVCGSDGSRFTLDDKVELDGTHVTEVKTAESQGSWIVQLSLDDEGRQLFGKLTTELAANPPPRNQLAIVVRGRVVSAPIVTSPITAGEVQISQASFAKKDAEKLAAEITG